MGDAGRDSEGYALDTELAEYEEVEDGFDDFEAELLTSYEAEGYDYDLDDELADSEADEETGLDVFEDYDHELDEAATCRNSRQVHIEGV